MIVPGNDADAPAAGAIPWLLLGAKSDGPQGSFSKTTSVQRVPYTADYYFFAR